MAELEQLASPLEFLKKKEAIESDALASLVNLFCATDSEIEPKRAELKIEEKQLAEIEKELQASLDQANQPEDDGVFKTDEWVLQYAAKGKATQVIDKQKILNILGAKVFLELADFKIADLKKYLTAAQFEEVTKEVRKNKRKLDYAKVSK